MSRTTAEGHDLAYTLNDEGIFVPRTAITHRDEEYPSEGFSTLLRMQEDHFWYRGRHRFLRYALQRHLRNRADDLKAIDLGGGLGGWLRYLDKSLPKRFKTLALADSSAMALRQATNVIPAGSPRYQVDLLDLQMESIWDVAFLLDVIEHIPDDVRALSETAKALKPGGLVFVTTPAFKAFWSYNDDIAHHQRRYTRKDFVALASRTGLRLVDARYFMFFLSPLYVISRLKPGNKNLTQEELTRLAQTQHAVPPEPANALLASVFAMETPIGHYLRFPWGTSILGVFQKD